MQSNYLPIENPILVSNERMKALDLAFEQSINLINTLELQGQVSLEEKSMLIKLFFHAYRNRKAFHFVNEKINQLKFKIDFDRYA